jgi:hypothetical protein
MQRRGVVVSSELEWSSQQPLCCGTLWNRVMCGKLHNGCVRRAVHIAPRLLLSTRLSHLDWHKLYERLLLRRWRRCSDRVYYRWLLLSGRRIDATFLCLCTGLLWREHCYYGEVHRRMLMRSWELLRPRIYGVLWWVLPRRPHVRGWLSAAGTLFHRWLLVPPWVVVVQFLGCSVQCRGFRYRCRRRALHGCDM